MITRPATETNTHPIMQRRYIVLFCRRSKSLVAVELKIAELQPEHAGEM
jgi:hypothetical protein